MHRIHYTKQEKETVIAVVNLVDIEEDVFIGKWKKKHKRNYAEIGAIMGRYRKMF